MLDNAMEVVLVIIGAIVLICGISILLAFPVMWCWNFVMPYLFGLKVLTWGKAWCLLFLSGMFFKSYNRNSNKE